MGMGRGAGLGPRTVLSFGYTPKRHRHNDTEFRPFFSFFLFFLFSLVCSQSLSPSSHVMVFSVVALLMDSSLMKYLWVRHEFIADASLLVLSVRAFLLFMINSCRYRTTISLYGPKGYYYRLSSFLYVCYFYFRPTHISADRRDGNLDYCLPENDSRAIAGVDERTGDIPWR